VKAKMFVQNFAALIGMYLQAVIFFRIWLFSFQSSNIQGACNI